MRKLDYKKINEFIHRFDRVLKYASYAGVIILIYVITLILQAWNILGIFGTILKILSPFFGAIVIAWLLDPLVSFLEKNGINRVSGALISFIVFVIGFYLIIRGVLPPLLEQINDFVNYIPKIITSASEFINGIFTSLSDTLGDYNLLEIRNKFINTIYNIGTNLAEGIPTVVMNVISSTLSFLGILLVSLVIAFYLLIDFKGFSKAIKYLIPKERRKQGLELITKLNVALQDYVLGMLILSFIIFVVTSLGLAIIGVTAPLLFGLVCGITNIIPYLGPYLGGVPTVIVAFSQGTTVGIITAIFITIVQFLEANFLQPYVMHKTTKINAVLILVGLLVFGSLFGIIGMLIATPIISVLKVLFLHFNEKYNFIELD